MADSGRDRGLPGAQSNLQQLVAVVRSLPLPMAVFDDKGVCIESNGANDELWGLPLTGVSMQSAQDRIGVAWNGAHRLLPGHDWPVNRVLSTRKPVLQKALTIAHPDGSVATLLVSAVPFFDENGKLLAVVTESHDVTDEREERRLGTVLNTINHLIHTTRDVIAILRPALEQGARALHARAASVELCEGGECVFRGVTGLPKSLLGTRISTAGVSGTATSKTAETEKSARSGTAGVQLLGPGDDGQRLPCEMRADSGIENTLLVPLHSRGADLGVLAFYFDRPANLREPVLDFCRELSLTLTAALENARQFEATIRAERRAEEQLETTQFLLGASRALASWSEPQAALHPLADYLLTATGHNRVTLFSWDEERSLMHVEAAAGQEPLPLGLNVAVADFTSMTRQALVTGDPVIVDTAVFPPEQRPYSTTWGMAYVLSVPLTFGRELVGLLTIDDTGVKRTFHDREIQIAKGIASQAAAAIMNARLHRRQEIELANTRLLQDVAMAGASGLDIGGACEHVVEELRHHLGVRALVHQLDRGAGQLRLVGATGYPKETLALLQTLPADPRSNIALAAADQLKSLTSPPASDAAGDASQADESRWVVLPIRHGTDMLGVLSLTFEGRRAFQKREIDLYRGVAATLGNAISNALLYEAKVKAQHEAEEELELSNLLLQAAEALSASVEVDALADEACNLIKRRVEMQVGGVILVQEDRKHLRVVAMRADSAPKFPDVTLPDGDPLIRMLDKLGEPSALIVESSDESLRDSVGTEAGRQLGWVRGLWAPMYTAGKLIGFVSADEPWEPREFSERDRQICLAVASEVAVSIDNARRYETQYRIAETLQQALIEIPSVPLGIEHAELYRSADELTSVGGDFYDIFELDAEHIAITIGDVSGKGLHAASLTSTVRDALRVLSLEGHSPAEVVRQTNALLYRITPVEMFVTLFFAVMNRRTGSMTYVIAAHPAPLVLHRNGDVDSLLGASHLVGAFPELIVDERTAKLQQGDVLFLYTDGLADVRSDGRLFGSGRIGSSLSRHLNWSDDLGELIGRVCADAEAFGKGILKDDMALMAIRLWPEPAR
ncbi:MAG: SpoIIE family protein phosphatase [Coriobacteriia bacterium]